MEIRARRASNTVEPDAARWNVPLLRIQTKIPVLVKCFLGARPNQTRLFAQARDGSAAR